MKEQEKMKKMLLKLIHETENYKITTCDEMIKALINELNGEGIAKSQSSVVN